MGDQSSPGALFSSNPQTPPPPGLLSCPTQTIQRRLNEIEADLRELEAKGTELELSLRSQSSE